MELQCDKYELEGEGMSESRVTVRARDEHDGN